jgi:hypothetical protein
MAERAGTLELVGVELASVLAPLEDRLRGGEILDLLAELGFAFPSELTEQGDLVQALEDAAGAAGKLPGLAAQLVAAIEQEDVAKIGQLAQQLIPLVKQVVTDIETIAGKLKAAAGALGGISPARIAKFAEELPERLLDYLVVSYIEVNHPLLLNLLLLLGIVELHDEPGDAADPTQPAYLHKLLHLDELGAWLRSPEEVLRRLYGWGGPSLEAGLLLERVRDVLSGLNVPAAVERPVGAPPVLKVLLFDVQPTTGVSPPGLDVSLLLSLDDGLDLGIPLTRTGWSLDLRVKGTLAADVGVTVTPPAKVAVKPPVGEVTGEVTLGLTGAPPDPVKPFLLIGQAGGSRLEAGSVAVRVGAGFTWDVAAGRALGEAVVEVGVGKGLAVVSFAGADTFLASMLSAQGLQAPFDLLAGWSSSRGVYFEGSGGLEVTLGLHASLGPFRVEALHLRIGVGANGLEVETSVSGSGSLGPVAAAVQRIGALATLRLERGNLGPVDLALAFRPPDGLGIRVDAGPVTGGGFMEIDRIHGRYAGILQLRIGTALSITAIGLLDTRLPGAQPGFSFLIIVTAKFSPIQLGFGFTLNGVGGLAGINRTIVVAALQAGVRAHSLDAILFPEDPVRDAPQIVSDLRAIFPPAVGRYVFGPMALLGYGSPTLIEAELGIILELPMPLRIILLGQLRASLPEKKSPVVELHLDVVGVLDLGAKTLAIDASLHDSRIAAFNLFGDMAMRLAWGADPVFVLSVGGFHPAFRAPPDFPQLRRLTLALGDGDNPRLTMQTYMAVTSNTFQVGARAELYAEEGGFSLSGWIGFDALFTFSPFSFQTTFSAGFALRRGDWLIAAVQLEANLTGPSPFHVWGEASISILFFTVTVAFDKTFGVQELVAVALGDPWALLRDAVADTRNWSALPPPAAFQIVSVTVAREEATVLLDPVGGLTLLQKVAPLNRTITIFGEAPLPGPVRFAPELGQVKVGAAPLTAAPVLIGDSFAPAQFERLADHEKLSRPSFERMDAGLSLASGSVECTVGGGIRGLDADYETVTIDAPQQPPTPVPGKYTLSAAQQLSVLGRAAAARSELLTTGLERFAPQPTAQPSVRLDDERFLVATTAKLQPRPDVLQEPSTKGAAFAALNRWLAARPEDRRLLQVVPANELAVIT